MMSARETQVVRNHTKLISANTKLKCVRTSQKWDIVHIELNVNSLTVNRSLWKVGLLLRRPTEQRNANRFGKKAYAVTDSDANFFIIKQNSKNKRIFSKLLVIYFVPLALMVKADWALSSNVMGTDSSLQSFIIYSLFFLFYTLL